MRANDAAVPAVTLDPDPSPPWMAGGRLVVALERLPRAAYVWDDDDPDVTWDDSTPERVWDAAFIGSGYTDVWCDMAALELVTGEPDGDGSYRTPYARLQLVDPGDGRYRSRDVSGRLVYYAIGRRLAVWWQDPGGSPWWLFSGSIATWRDPFNSRVVTVEAYGCPGVLGQTIGQDWTAGTDGQLPAARLQSILTTLAPAITVRQRFDAGTATLSVPAPSDVAPLDELRRVARSDGGLVYADADDTLVYRDRRWREGRPDQTTVPVWTDNVCDAGAGSVVLWDVESANVDLVLAGTVRLANAADPPLVAVATGSGDVPPTVIYTHPTPDLWRTQTEGNNLAAHLATYRADARMALATAAVYLHDRRYDYWAQTIDRRLGDVVRFQHTETWTDPDRTDFYDLALILTTIRHTITPDTWLVELATSPAVSWSLIELWDDTILTWDDPSPLAVWR